MARPAAAKQLHACCASAITASDLGFCSCCECIYPAYSTPCPSANSTILAALLPTKPSRFCTVVPYTTQFEKDHDWHQYRHEAHDIRHDYEHTKDYDSHEEKVSCST
jgi:hypothetical protein